MPRYICHSCQRVMDLRFEPTETTGYCPGCAAKIGEPRATERRSALDGCISFFGYCLLIAAISALLYLATVLIIWLS